MFALRTTARAAPRLANARISTKSATMARSAFKAATIFVSRTTIPTLNHAYSTEVSKPGEVDVELSTKLSEEIKFEADIKKDEPPASIKEFMDSGLWKVTDIPGRDDVVLTREFGKEKITITFSIVDLANFEDAENPLYEEDDADYDAEGAQDSQGQEEGPEGNAPCRLHIVIEKPKESPGALNIEATAGYDRINIDSVFYYKDAKLAHTSTPDAEFASQELYPGPPFESIDVEVQTLMDRYAEERGINQALAVFAADYMAWKEQKEYVSWLENVKKFVDA